MAPEPQNPETDAVPLTITAEMLAPVDQRIDFERGISFLPWLTVLLIAACVGVFIWEILVGAMENTAAIIDAGALWKPAVLQGQVWRPVTAMFLHGGFDHLIGNCLVLYVLGMAIEHAFGLARAGIIYFFSGICGAILSLAMTEGPSVGASGAIFGLSAGLIVFLYRFGNLFLVRDKRIGLVLLIWAFYTVGTGFLTPAIDNFCHIGGFIGGALMGAILPRRDRPELQQAFGVILNPPSPPTENRGS